MAKQGDNAKPKKEKNLKLSESMKGNKNAIGNEGGRPSDYKPEYANQAYKMRLLKADPYFLAYFFDVSVYTIHFWIENIPEFKNAIEQADIDLPNVLKAKEEAKRKRREYKKQKHIKATSSLYIKEKRLTDIQFRLRMNVSSLIRSRLMNKPDNSSLYYLDHSIQELKLHLESMFKDGMSWGNYGDVWHIDHRIPDSWFDYQSTQDEDFKKSWALSNLQPLFKHDNLSKGNRYAS